MKDKENGLGNYNLEISLDALKYIAMCSNGDVRTALNGLEIAVLTTGLDKDGYIIDDLDVDNESKYIRNRVRNNRTN